MSDLKFVNVNELKKQAEKLNLSVKITENLILNIRHLHFVKGFDKKNIFSHLNLPNNESMNLLFLKILGYSDWDSYHKNREKIIDSIEEKTHVNEKSTESDSNIITENKEKVETSKKKVCILNLENNKYYVGETNSVDKFINKIKSGYGPRWTQIHKFISINQILEDSNLIQVTLDTMKKFGWKNVRGYAWSQVNMKKPPLELRKTMGTEEINQEKFNETVYVLKLEHDKWFLNKCLDEYLEKRINRYKLFGGNPWIKEHKVVEIKRFVKNGDLQALTLEYMKKYGWQNVRGHHWLKKDMRNPPKELSQVISKINNKVESEHEKLNKKNINIIDSEKAFNNIESKKKEGFCIVCSSNIVRDVSDKIKDVVCSHCNNEKKGYQGLFCHYCGNKKEYAGKDSPLCKACWFKYKAERDNKSKIQNN